MKPHERYECLHFLDGYCTRYGFMIDPCNAEGCENATVVCTLVYADPEYEPFIDELNRRLDKGV